MSTIPAANRPVAMGVNGMVTSAHPLASLAGQRMLIQGGNAFDAAVATAAALNVVEPYMSGVGGIGVALAYIAKEKRVRALNFSGRTPRSANPDLFTNQNKQTGILAPLIPGNVAGWLTLHENYGILDREQIFQPAIEYAEDGFPVTHLNSRIMARSAIRLSLYPSASIILNNNGGTPPPGSRLTMPFLAESLRKIAKDGKETFYRGELAELIVAGNQELGGLYTLDDFADYEAVWQEPIAIDYRGYKIHTTPPNSSGFQILEALKIMEGLKSKDLIFQHPDTLHFLIEAIKLSVTDRIKYGGDPDHVKTPIKGLLSESYAETQRGRIDPTKVAPVSGEHFTSHIPTGSLLAGSPDEFDGGMTTHFATADRDGNVVTVTQTLGGGFGCAVAPRDTGIFLNNMSFWFDIEEESPNRIGPEKRVDFCLAPTQTLKQGDFLLSIGTPGGWGILQTTPQFIMHVLDHKMNIQEAIEAPRFRCVQGNQVEMEERFPLHVRRALEDKGHDIDIIEAFSMSVGGCQGLQIDSESGVFQGGADPRRDGLAIGW